MSDDPYVYPGTDILRNRLNLRDAARLDRIERQFATQRAREGLPGGIFDLAHLQEIHRHLFQDIYDWAGQLRTVALAKGGNHFIPAHLIERGMSDVQRQLEAADYLQGLDRRAFAMAAGKVIGDINYVHPFREGNGRTQLLYLEQLADHAGHFLDLTRLEPEAWLEASKAAHMGEYASMGEQLAGIMSGG